MNNSFLFGDPDDKPDYQNLTDEQYDKLADEYGYDNVDNFIEQLHNDEHVDDIDDFAESEDIQKYGMTDEDLDVGDDN